MTPRQENILFFVVITGAAIVAMVERLRNYVRDVVDDYPLYAVLLCFGFGFVTGIAL